MDLCSLPPPPPPSPPCWIPLAPETLNHSLNIRFSSFINEKVKILERDQGERDVFYHTEHRLLTKEMW